MQVNILKEPVRKRGNEEGEEGGYQRLMLGLQKNTNMNC